MPTPQITWEDVRQLPDDGNRYEAIEGALYMTPAPSVRHQRISFRLQRELARLLVDPGHGELLYAPIGVHFPATQEGVQRRLYQRQGVAEYWIADPDANAVDVWRFGDEPRSERFVDALPVRLDVERLGDIDLGVVFAEA